MREEKSVHQFHSKNEAYFARLKDYRRRGVRILIEGVEEPETRWNELLGVREDEGFYMGDYILGKEVGAEKEILKEIRFDRVKE